MESSMVSSLERIMEMLEESSMESSIGIHTRFREEYPLCKSFRESSMEALKEILEGILYGNPRGIAGKSLWESFTEPRK